jgi:N4-gp56 family major capsid protein
MITNTNTLQPEVQQTMDDILLAVPTPGLIMKLGAEEKRLRSKGGKFLRQSRYSRLPTAPEPLDSNGAERTPFAVNRVDIDAEMKFYGGFIAVNQQVTLQNQDAVLSEFANLLGLSMRMTEDQLARDCLMSTASVYRCTGGNNGNLPTNLSLPDLDDVTAALATNDAVMVLDSQVGMDRIGTGPLRNAFLALGHTKLIPELNNLVGFQSKWNYPLGARTESTEFGAVNNIRFFLSSVAAVLPYASRLGTDIYSVFVQGMESFGVVYQDNYSSQFIYRPAIYSDALAQNVTCAYVFGEAPVILNDLWLFNVQCTLRSV